MYKTSSKTAEKPRKRAVKYWDAAFSATMPGMSLKDFVTTSEMDYSKLARLIPCSVSYPRLIAEGLARPSYEMAVRIEKVTMGCVPRTRWYPAPLDSD